MTILFDSEIWAAYQAKLFDIDPPIRGSEDMHRIQPASIDVRMGNMLLKQSITGRPHRMKDSAAFLEMQPYQDEYTLEPGNFFLGHTMETVRLGKKILMQIEGKSSWGRLGLEIHSTAGWIDPGFEGQLTLEMKVIGKDPVVVKIGDPIAQLSVHQSRVGSVVPYGHPARKSKYQGQMGPTKNRG